MSNDSKIKFILNNNDQAESDNNDQAEPDEDVIINEKHMIHPKEWKRFKEMINASVEQANEYARAYEHGKCSTIIRQRQHNTIMLGGERGSGKTTFLLSAIESIKKNKNDFPSKELKPLQIIDPTLIEPKIHIFVNIVSVIRRTVMERFEKLSCCRKDDAIFQKFETWRESFRKMAEGLPCINGIGSNFFTSDDWQDSEFIMQKGVQRADAAHSLERNFHDYVHKSLEFIKKKAFILCFDDIDTHFEKGKPVLSVIHKYLTTPQLIVVLSGDPQLYSLLIRQKQWKNFSHRILEKEKGRDFNGMVDHLESQFFLKILKPERRIFLSNLYEKTRLRGEYDLQVNFSGNKYPLTEFYDENLGKLQICGKNHYSLYRRFLLSLPIRTQRQILLTMKNLEKDAEDKNDAFKTTNFAHSILHIFWSDLAGKYVDVSSLRNTPQFTILIILKYLVENKILNQGYLLKPNFSDQMKDSAQFALGALVVSEIYKNSAIVFDYWIRIALVRELAIRFRDDPDARKSDNRTNGPSIDDLIGHCAMYYDKSPRHVARFTVSYMRALKGWPKGNKSADSWQGTLPLYGLAKKANKRDLSRIDTVIEQIEKRATDEPLAAVAAMVAGLPLSGVIDHTGNTLPVYSFYSLLGVIGELVYAVKDVGLQKNDSGNDQDPKDADLQKNDNGNDQDLKVAIYRVLKTNNQFKEYPMPGWSSPESDTHKESEEAFLEGGGAITSEDKVISSPFLDRIIQWVKDGENIDVTAALLGKIFTRFFYTLNNMDKNQTLRQEHRLGEWMHRMIVAFLNAAVVMESLDKAGLQYVGISLHNPITKNIKFRTNLQKLNANKVEAEKLTFSKWLLACPIWPFFMNPESDEKEQNNSSIVPSKSLKELSLFTTGKKSTEDNDSGYISLYDDLKKVIVIGHTQKFNINDQDHLNAAIEVFKEVIEEHKPDENSAKNFEEIEFDKNIRNKLKDKLKSELEEKYDMSGVTLSTVNSILKRLEKDPDLWK